MPVRPTPNARPYLDRIRPRTYWGLTVSDTPRALANPRKPPGLENTAFVIYRSQAFRDACAARGIEPSVRQARKYRARTHRWAS